MVYKCDSLFNIDVFTKHAWFKPLKDKKAETDLHGFTEIVNEYKLKPSKLLVDQGKEFYNKLIKKQLDNNDILMYSTHNEGKSIFVERFIRSLKGKINEKWQ